MPFRNAHWFILSLFPLAALAFWPQYLSALPTSPLSYHLHGATASLWLLLLAVQSWSIHHDRRAFHRVNGLVSLALFPLFLAGGAGIFIGMAERYVASASPFYEIWPPRLAWLDFVAIAGMAWFYYMALKHRRRVGTHASYLLATAIFLLPPILGRLAPIPLGIDFSQPGAFEQLGTGFHLGNVLTALISFAIAARSGRNGKPFVIAGVLSLLASLLFEFPGATETWSALYRNAALIPLLPMVASATIAGAVVGWAGWVAGKRPGSRAESRA
jgi:hypothetical protein